MALVHAYCNELQLRDQFADAGSLVDTGVLERAINASSRAIDRYCGRRFWLDAQVTTRLYRPCEPDIAWVDDIGSTAGLIIKTDHDDDGVFEQTWVAGQDYELEPGNADADGGAYAWWRIVAVGDLRFPTTGRRKRLQDTGLHGWSQIPDEVEQACLLKSAGLVKRKDSPHGVMGFDGFGAVRVTRQDPDVVALLRPYMRLQIGAV